MGASEEKAFTNDDAQTHLLISPSCFAACGQCAKKEAEIGGGCTRWSCSGNSCVESLDANKSVRQQRREATAQDVTLKRGERTDAALKPWRQVIAAASRCAQRAIFAVKRNSAADLSELSVQRKSRHAGIWRCAGIPSSDRTYLTRRLARPDRQLFQAAERRSRATPSCSCKRISAAAKPIVCWRFIIWLQRCTTSCSRYRVISHEDIITQIGAVDDFDYDLSGAPRCDRRHRALTGRNRAISKPIARHAQSLGEIAYQLGSVASL